MKDKGGRIKIPGFYDDCFSRRHPPEPKPSTIALLKELGAKK